MLRITELKIQGFRGLRNITIPLEPFTIFIGRNNSGKSSALLAIRLLMEGTSKDFSETDFFAQVQQRRTGKGKEERVDQIILEATLTGVSQYLPQIASQHRSKIEKCLESDQIRIQRTVVRKGSQVEVGKLQIWDPQEGKFGLPTGIENALKSLLPEIIYIEAFKDPAAEAQAGSRTTMGQIIGRIAETLIGQVGDKIQRDFNRAERMLNAPRSRPQKIRETEERIRGHLQPLFEGIDVRLRFQFPELRTLMNSAAILELRDRPRGAWTPPDQQGQGVQRLLYLALLRVLSELPTGEGELPWPFILLFEEPESFLHPALQEEIRDVLDKISQTNQVIITTHSPLIVSPQAIDNVRIFYQTTGTKRQILKCLQLNLTPLGDKQIQSLLQFANSSEFLFSDYILVVEGPSDRNYLESCWYVLKTKLTEQPTVIGFVEAGSKDVIPRLVKALRGSGFLTFGVVDLDFLWRGAGELLKNDREYNRFQNEFWEQARNYNWIGEPGKIKDTHKKEASEWAKGHKLFDTLRERLRAQHYIWVFREGEIEQYFGLSTTSKGKYLEVCREIRERRRSIPAEFEEIYRWTLGFK